MQKDFFPKISPFDLFFLAALWAIGWAYLHRPFYWGDGFIGESQYGDAQFWWDGAVQFARGIIHDHVGKGYHPGYFVLTGLSLPVLGETFQGFFSYFLILFFACTGFFYLALRHYLGKLGALCAVGLLVLNPYTAEWLATSTTDGLGLILHMVALSCLLIGCRPPQKLRWPILFGLFFALASITRPLVVPFIGVVCLGLFFFLKAPAKKRMQMVGAVLMAFLLPIGCWMGVQKITINEWSLSSNDASAFYAASHPTIQVWSPDIYPAIQQAAAKQYHISPLSVDNHQLNHLFWQETIKNYQRYAPYHFKRAWPHFSAIAGFVSAPRFSAHGTPYWHLFFLIGFSVILMFAFIAQSRFFPAFCAAMIGYLIYACPSFSVPALVVLGVLLACTRPHKHLGLFFLGAYWLVGVWALYGVGGTWGPPATLEFGLNALGYRLGSQIFFIGDVLSVYALLQVFRFFSPLKPTQKAQWAFVPNVFASQFVFYGAMFFLGALGLLYSAGTAMVTLRTFAHEQGTPISYPPLQAVKAASQKWIGHVPLEGEIEQGALKNVPENTDILFTGAFSPFIWNFPGQPRAQLMVFAQKQISPYTMGPATFILEVPRHLALKEWAEKQGAFIIRKIPQYHNLGYMPYYLTVPQILAFVPLSKDHQRFLLEKAVFFPINQNATQLESNGTLRFEHATIKWSTNSGQALYKRRFLFSPSGKDFPRMVFHFEKNHSLKTVRFEYEGEALPIHVLLNEKFSQRLASRLDDSSHLQKVEFVVPPNVKAMALAWHIQHPVWVYELNMADDK